MLSSLSHHTAHIKHSRHSKTCFLFSYNKFGQISYIAINSHFYLKIDKLIMAECCNVFIIKPSMFEMEKICIAETLRSFCPRSGNPDL